LGSWKLEPRKGIPASKLQTMKILVANIGTTSLKWRLFDFSNGAERVVHKGGFERVTDYPKAIEDCLTELKSSNA
jgi:acetate kinase